MKARKLKDRKIVLFFQAFIIACLIILNPSCGLEEYYVLYGPSIGQNYPVITTDVTDISYESRYVEFITNSSDSSSGGFDIDGTEVYYKLYSNLNTCKTEYSALNNLLNNSTTKASSANSLINSYKFQKLKNSNRSSDVLISHDGSSVLVKIRLTQYLENQDAQEYQMYIMENGSVSGYPMRYYGSRYFDFVRNSDSLPFNAPLPRTTSYEEDVSSNTTEDDNGYWYINLYAVTIGHDATFTTYYSPILHLGTLAINPKSYEN